MKLFTGCLLCALLLSSVAGAAESWSQLQARMDKAAASFHGMTASLKRLTHTAVINDDTEETGTVTMRKVGRRAQGLIDFTSPDKKTVAFADRKLEIYFPKIKTVQEFDLGAHGEQLDQFLMIGFGTTGKDVAQAYAVKVLGEDSVQGHPATKLELTPKTKEARKYLKKLELWIPEGETYPIRERLYEPSGNYTVVSYDDLKINPPVRNEDLALKLPAGVKREYPQKQ